MEQEKEISLKEVALKLQEQDAHVRAQAMIYSAQECHKELKNFIEKYGTLSGKRD